MPHAEDMTLVEFDTEVRLSRYSQDDFARLVERIRGRKPFGFTALYDALGTYLAGASELDGRKVLIIYTDGGDTRSSMSWSETLGLLKASDVTIHSIGFLEHQSAAAQFAQKRQLQQIAEITGGRAFFPRDGKDVDLAYDSILAELEAQYVMGYISTNPRMDGRWRKVEIKVKRPELKRAQIRTRPGYFARRRETVP
jgi:Ca-activated chloride channel family protein